MVRLSSFFFRYPFFLIKPMPFSASLLRLFLLFVCNEDRRGPMGIFLGKPVWVCLLSLVLSGRNGAGLKWFGPARCRNLPELASCASRPGKFRLSPFLCRPPLP